MLKIILKAAVGLSLVVLVGCGGYEGDVEHCLSIHAKKNPKMTTTVNEVVKINHKLWRINLNEFQQFDHGGKWDKKYNYFCAISVDGNYVEMQLDLKRAKRFSGTAL